MPTRIIFISIDGMTDPLGQSQVIPYLAGLSEQGFTISIVSCEKRNNFEKNNSVVKELLSKSKIEWIYCFYENNIPIFSQNKNLKRLTKLTRGLVEKENKKIILHCRSYMAALIGLKLKKKYNTKFVFDMRGFWADERIDGDIWKKKNVVHQRLYKFFKKKEIEFLNGADYTISLTQNAKNEILSWEPFSKKTIPIEVIPCCVDLNHFSINNIDTKIINEAKSKLKISQDDFIISYLGSIGTWYMLDEMLDFFKALLNKKANAKFLFITPDNPEQIFKAAEKIGLTKEKLIIVSANRNEVPIYLSLSHISLYFIKPVYSKRASSPTKTGEIMAMGIPIITNSGIGDSDMILTDSKAGLLVKSFSMLEYNRIIEQIDVLLKTNKDEIVKASKSYFSLEKGIELYASVYNKLLNKK